jgi:hypothetical protein
MILHLEVDDEVAVGRDGLKLHGQTQMSFRVRILGYERRLSRALHGDADTREAHLEIEIELLAVCRGRDRDARVMEAREAAILQGFGFCDPYHRQT